MSVSTRVGLRERELVAVVGAGGKTTLVVGLGAAGLAEGRSVLLTTTTRMSTDQVPPWAAPIRSLEPIDRGSARFLLGEIDGEKVIGVAPGVVDLAFVRGDADLVLVEADGARRHPFKAPADHEPVIPEATTLVVIVVGMAAIGSPISEVTHRPERVASIAGCGVTDLVRPEHVARVVSDPMGGLKGVPNAARAVVALTASTAAHQRSADQVAARLADHDRIERVVVLGAEDMS